MPFGISLWEIAILLLVALVIFGPKRLPEMGRSLGRGMREFKESITGRDTDEDEERRHELVPPVEPPATAPPRAETRERDTVS